MVFKVTGEAIINHFSKLRIMKDLLLNSKKVLFIFSKGVISDTYITYGISEKWKTHCPSSSFFIHHSQAENSLARNPLITQMQKQILNPCTELGQTVMRLWVSHIQVKCPNHSTTALSKPTLLHQGQFSFEKCPTN